MRLLVSVFHSTSARAAKELWVGKTLGLAAVGEGPQGHVQLCYAHASAGLWTREGRGSRILSPG